MCMCIHVHHLRICLLHTMTAALTIDREFGNIYLALDAGNIFVNQIACQGLEFVCRSLGFFLGAWTPSWKRFLIGLLVVALDLYAGPEICFWGLSPVAGNAFQIRLLAGASCLYIRPSICFWELGPVAGHVFRSVLVGALDLYVRPLICFWGLGPVDASCNF